MAQYAAVETLARRPTQQDTSSCIGGGQRKNKLYALQARYEKEDFPNVVVGN